MVAQRKFYRAQFRSHGEAPQALGWNDHPTQEERFARLLRPVPARAITLHDVGCGFADLRDCPLLPKLVEYSGSDLYAGFVMASRARHPDCRFHLAQFHRVPGRFDVVLASGIFNRRFGASAGDWRTYVRATLTEMFQRSTLFIGTNFLSSVASVRLPDHHYEDAADLMPFLQSLSRFVSIDCQGPLFEITAHVFHESHVRSLYPRPAFDKYWSAA